MLPEQNKLDVEIKASRMHITQAEVLDFARWSGDRNPIHVDAEAAKNSAFGSTIVHGILSTIGALRAAGRGYSSRQFINALEIQFRGEIRPEREYRVEASSSLGSLTATIFSGDHVQLTISAESNPSIDGSTTIDDSGANGCDWSSQARSSGILTSGNDEPCDWQTSDFRAGSTVQGTHRFGNHSATSDSLLSTTQEQVLGLCSFMVGMKAPGLSSLFTRLKVRFGSAETQSDELTYRLTFRNYEPYFRMLETELEIATCDGRFVAFAEMQSYVRFPNVEATPTNYVASLGIATQQLAGKVALVCGASRGLGAEIAAALGAAKCHVYLACRHPNSAIKALVEKIRDCGASAEVIAGDVGDPGWCSSTREHILKERGQLDLLVLNACEPPRPQALAEIDPQQATAYIVRNIALAQVPMISFMPSIIESKGTVVAISSSSVVEYPHGFGDYVAVKMAMEGAIKTAATENSLVNFVIARPGKLRTSWNDSPARAGGVIPPAVVANRLVEAVASGWDASNLKIEDRFEFDGSTDAIGKDWRAFEFVLCASFTLDPIDESLSHWSTELQWNIRAEHAPYAQILQETLNPSSSMARSAGGSVVLLRICDWLRELPAERLNDQEDVRAWLQSLADEHVEALKLHRTFAAGPTLLIFCPSSDHGPFAAQELSELQQRMQSAVLGTAGLTVMDATVFHSRYDVPENAIHDRLREDIAHIPFQNAYYHFLATLIVRFFHRSLNKPKKVVVLDCDNTLWRGVVGEVGPQGIFFDEIHHRLHTRLSQLAESGMLLCLCSKNEEHDVWSVFENRKEFGLRREQIVAATVNWLPKSENILALSESLNLGLDSFIFFDDNPVECAEVRSGCPSVLTIQWPHDATAAAALLDHLWELDVYSTTAEDRNRTQMYREEFQRQQVQNHSRNFQEFIDSLQLKITVEALSPDDLSRASQLTLRTNQFNLTTVRRSEAELVQLTSNPRVDCRTVRVSDRFGDYGLVGFLVASSGQDLLDVDSFMLSCRVLGRGVEHQMVVELGKLALNRGLSKVRFCHLPTERNTPARNFLLQLANGRLPADMSVASEYVADALSLTETKFQAEVSNATEDTASALQSSAGTRATVDRPRQRELQINRITADLSSYALLSNAFGDGAGTLVADESTQDVAEVVKSTFAKSLRLTVEEVGKIDRLEAMGCDSLRIVEITVALTRQFAWLPKTLLFEHRSVSEIIQRITDLRSGNTKSEPARSLGSTSTQNRETGSHAIAIVGMGVRCAGGNSPDELWDFLAHGKTAIRPVPEVRDSFVGRLNDARPHFAGLIDGAADFDCAFFGISPREAEYMDPQLRLMLQTTWQALEDAGSTGEAFDKSSGVFVGAMYSCYGRFANAVATQTGSIYRCWESFSLANRLSQVLGCNGPSLSIDTACSSSATALHYACESMRRGDCTSAIVSGVNLIVDPDRLVQFTKLGILSPSGRCVPFGDEADGTVLGEGVVTLVLRPLSEAQRRGDRVYAIIQGTGVSVGAGSVGFTAPNPVAQAAAIARAIADAHIDARTVTYIETHGTGTELGDPIEVRGLELAYCNRQSWSDDLTITHQCAIGSIKPNVGHLEAGAGLMGVMKAALQLHHRMRLPSLTSKALNPTIDFAQLPFRVQQSYEPWPATQATHAGRPIDIPRRAGVNSFGVGGSNVHVILEECPVSEIATPLPAVERSSQLLAISADSESALRLQASAWRTYLTSLAPEKVADACFSANVGRKHLRLRATAVIGGETNPLDNLERLAAGADRRAAERFTEGAVEMRTAFLFTGQGAQYPGMMRELYRSSPVFRDAFDRCADCLDGLLPERIHAIVFSEQVEDREHPLHQTHYTQPALFAVQFALYQLWSSWGIAGDVFMGHSIGEIAAYCVAGGCSLEDAARLVAARGRLMQQLPSGGAMCALPLEAATVRAALDGFDDRVSIAALNGPKQTVISGQRPAVEVIAQRLERAHAIKPSMLSVSHAFHSALMEPMLDEFERVLQTLELGVPERRIVSSALGTVINHEMATPQYWLEQVRNPVRFTDAMAELARQGVTHYVELGPHPVMLAMGRQCLTDPAIKWLPSARRGKSDWSIVLESLGELYADGALVDWKSFDAPYARTRLQVPYYQFDTRRIWLEQLDANDRQTPFHRVAAAIPNGDDLAYELQWCEQNRSLTESTQVTEPKSWLVISDQLATLTEATDALRSQGLACTPAILNLDAVAGNGSPEVASRGQLGSSPVIANSPHALKSLLGDLKSFERVVYVDSASSEMQDDAASLNANAIHKCYQLSQVTAAISNIAQDRPRRLWVVTKHAVPAPGGDPLNLSATPLWGFARVAALECPTCWGGIADIDSWSQQAQVLVREINHPGDDDQVALRSDKRFVPRLHRLTEVGETHRLDLAKVLASGSVLITGGLGGIGLQLANWLADRGSRRVMLTSRTGVPAANANQQIELLRTRGIDVVVVKSDVATPDGITACFQALGDSPLVGIFHAAGLDLECPIVGTQRADIERLFESKVKGAWLLHQASRRAELKIFVCVSSISSIWGSSGRSIYASANAFLDGLTHFRRSLGLPSLVVNLGPWAGGGMADTAALEQLANIGNRGLQPGAALDCIGKRLERGATQSVIADVAWTRFRPIVEARRSRPILGELGREPTCRVTTDVPTSLRPWSAELGSLPDDERRQQLMERLRSEVAETLRMTNPRGIPIDRNLFEIGMDSITATEFAMRIQKQTGFRSATLLADHPTIQRMADALLVAVAANYSEAKIRADSGLSGGAWIENLSSKSDAARQAELVTLLRRELGATLRYKDDSRIETHKSFSELGLDSLAAVDFATRVRSQMNLAQMPRVLEYQNLNRLAAFLAENLPPSEPSDISNYDESLAPAVAQFCEQAWPSRPKQWNVPRWKWMFLESARRLNIAPKLWLFRDNGRIVGQMGAQHVRLKIGDVEKNTAYLVETMVLESHRELGVGARIILQAQEDMPFCLSLGQTAQIRTMLEKLGWKYIAPLPIFFLPINATRVLRGKLPMGIASVGAGILKLRASSRRLFAAAPSEPVATRTIDRFDERHDHLWQTVSACYGCGVVRDASYLNWKYVDQPGQNFVRLEVRRQEQVIGCVVLAYMAPDRVYNYSRVNIIDLVVSTRAEDLFAVLHATVSCSRMQLGADAVVMQVINPSIELALERYGFLRREAARHLMISIEEDGDCGALLDASRWLITLGDSDIDRPGQSS